MEALEAIAQRKSTRGYAARPVEEGKIDILLKAGNSAPCVGGIHFAVITNPAVLKTVNEKSLHLMKTSGNAFLMGRAALQGYMPLYGAPLLIMVCSLRNTYSEANCAAAVTNMCIAATDVGLGSCYVITPTAAIASDPGLQKAIGLPLDFEPFCGIIAGYAGYDPYAATGTPHGKRRESISYCR